MTNSQLSTTDPKKQKQKRTKQRIAEMEIKWRVISWEGEGENGGKGTGNKKYNW